MVTRQIETRERILRSTRKLMERGAASGKGVRMSDIAKSAKVSRQAVYLHFKSRAELLIATAEYVDDLNCVEQGMAEVAQANNGSEQLTLWIRYWGNYLPEIYGMARALMIDRHVDAAADAVWRDRMAGVRGACHRVVKRLEKERLLARGWTVEAATDFLAAMLSIAQWEQLTQECGWSNEEYIKRLEVQAKSTFVRS